MGVSEDDILNKGFNTLKEMDGKGLIKDGPTQIKTHINGMEAEIKIYIKDGEIISFDMFKGWSVRDMGNTIYY